MLHNIDLKSKLVKSRTRKGIPDSMRGTVWCAFAKTQDFEVPKECEGDIKLWVKSILQQELPDMDRKCIYKDVTRTQPLHVIFSDDYGPG